MAEIVNYYYEGNLKFTVCHRLWQVIYLWPQVIQVWGPRGGRWGWGRPERTARNWDCLDSTFIVLYSIYFKHLLEWRIPLLNVTTNKVGTFSHISPNMSVSIIVSENTIQRLPVVEYANFLTNRDYPEPFGFQTSMWWYDIARLGNLRGWQWRKGDTCRRLRVWWRA